MKLHDLDTLIEQSPLLIYNFFHPGETTIFSQLGCFCVDTNLCILKKYLHTNESCVIISNQKQPSCKKRCGPHKGHGEKRCEIQGGGQEMAVMVG